VRVIGTYAGILKSAPCALRWPPTTPEWRRRRPVSDNAVSRSLSPSRGRTVALPGFEGVPCSILLLIVGVFCHHRKLICILALVAAFVGVVAYAAQNHDLPVFLVASALPILLNPEPNPRPHSLIECPAQPRAPFLSDTPDRAPPLSRSDRFV
jgi:hypothetical protein